jgi:hypothetical protein
MGTGPLGIGERANVMAIRVLIEKGPASMFIPGELVQEYLAQGWVEISREVIDAEVKQPESIKPAAMVKPKAGTRVRKSAG